MTFNLNLFATTTILSGKAPNTLVEEWAVSMPCLGLSWRMALMGDENIVESLHRAIPRNALEVIEVCVQAVSKLRFC